MGDRTTDLPRDLPRCCTPRQYHAPSGLAWFHTRECPVGRGQKIRNVHQHVAAQRHRVAEQKAETHRAGVTVLPVQRTDIHPACLAAVTDGATPCSVCSWRLGLDNEGASFTQAKLDEMGL